MMEECLAECCGQICVRLSFLGLATAMLHIVDKLIVQRRELVIRLGRQAQRILHVPECLRVFSDEEPGMLDGDIRMAGTCLIISYLIATTPFLVATLLGASLWGPGTWTLGIANPLCVSIVVLVELIKSKRKREGPCCKTLEEGHAIRDRSLDDDMRFLWSPSC
ncbi:hypothetical protein F4821DRAFT_177838 [Hypoxylon rubiginosum]|uniref:Uncharacterized protein n=1 Tax=Hypoxylon rubiginosum TaxID=110542 RepID=A0ACC0CV30_9PEZI|nr:hypothetical protein F4821DRAFT_177838 [Hypoxylon rubiginosum]